MSGRQPGHDDRLRPLHKLDPELYLRDVFRVLLHWPYAEPDDAGSRAPS